MDVMLTGGGQVGQDARFPVAITDESILSEWFVSSFSRALGMTRHFVQTFIFPRG